MPLHASLPPSVRGLVRLLPLILALAACEVADDDGPGEVSDDPRCSALCSDEAPERDDAFAVCSAQSLQQCGELCEARIASSENLCAECLLEDAQLPTPVDESSAHEVCVDDGVCYLGLSRWCEDSCWVSPGVVSCGGSCDGAVEGYEAEVEDGDACAFDDNDEAARSACYQELYPRQDVTCEPVFRPVTDCTELCTST